MPIIKDYNLDHNYEDTPFEISRPGKVIKASSLKQVNDVVTPGQVSDDIQFQDSLEDEPLDDSNFTEIDDDQHSLSAPEPEPQAVVDESQIRQEIEQELKSHVDELLAGIESLKAARDEVVKSAETQLVDLSLVIAEKVVQKQIEMDPSIITSVVEDTFNKISGSDRITFKINPADAETFNEFQPYLESRLIGVEKVTIQQDGTIAQGGCIIETDLGFVDVTLKEKFNIIAQTFKKVKSTL